MKRRIGVIALAAIACAGWGTAAHARGVATSASEYWGCVVADDIDLGLCLKDPAPGPLPLPDPNVVPQLPATPV